MPRILGSVLIVLAGLAFAGEAQACVCVAAPIGERLDEADAAVVGRVTSERTGEQRGVRQRLLTFTVDQRVKGDIGDQIVVRSPSGSDCDLAPARGRQIGLLLTRAPNGTWLGTLCSLVGPGELVAAGGEPRGGVIKVGVGLVILGLVLLWAFRRLRRGSRPELPGAPR
jgi:hypothetical protein